MQLFRIQNRVSGGAIGIRAATIQDPKEFIESIQRQFLKLAVQAFEAKFIAGFTHARLLMQQSWEAKRRGISYARKLELDILLRVALSSQITEALNKVGLRPGNMDIVILALGLVRELEELNKYCGRLGALDDRILNLSQAKESFLTKFHRLKQDFTTTTTVGEDALAYLLAERAVLPGVRER